MTRLTVVKLLSDKRQMGRSIKDLRFQLMNIKKEMLKMKTCFVVQKTKMKQKIMNLKKDNLNMKKDLKVFMNDGVYLSDENGIIDVSNDDDQPQTPEKGKVKMVSYTPFIKKEK